MLNTIQLNTTPYNSIAPASASESVGTIEYNGFNLQTDSIVISNLSYDNGHKIDYDTYKRSRANGGGVLGYFYRQKLISATGVIRASTASEFEAKLSELKQKLGQSEKTLKIIVDGVVRQGTASVVNWAGMFAREHYHITFLPFNIQFALEEFMSQPTLQEVYQPSITSSLETEIGVIGEVTSKPTYRISVTSGTITDVTVAITGVSSATWTGSLTTGDILEFTQEKTAEKNATVNDYSGIIPDLEVGNNAMTVTLTGGGTVDINVLYPINYL